MTTVWTGLICCYRQLLPSKRLSLTFVWVPSAINRSPPDSRSSPELSLHIFALLSSIELIHSSRCWLLLPSLITSIHSVMCHPSRHLIIGSLDHLTSLRDWPLLFTLPPPQPQSRNFPSKIFRMFGCCLTLTRLWLIRSDLILVGRLKLSVTCLGAVVSSTFSALLDWPLILYCCLLWPGEVTVLRCYCT